MMSENFSRTDEQSIKQLIESWDSLLERSKSKAVYALSDLIFSKHFVALRDYYGNTNIIVLSSAESSLKLWLIHFSSATPHERNPFTFLLQKPFHNQGGTGNQPTATYMLLNSVKINLLRKF